jgi:hypothetical protein
MSRQYRIHVDGSASTVPELRSWAVHQPLREESLNVRIRRLGMTPSKILPHQFEPRLEQIEGGPERGNDR